MAKVEAAVYGTHLRALNSSDGLRAAVLASPWPASGITVPIQFHIIQWQGSSSVTDTTSPQVNTGALVRQLAVLNRDYEAVGISFVLAGAPMFHSNQAWTANCMAELDQIISTVVFRPTRTLNIILCDLYSQGGLLGWAGRRGACWCCACQWRGMHAH